MAGLGERRAGLDRRLCRGSSKLRVGMSGSVGVGEIGHAASRGGATRAGQSALARRVTY